ncbi:hypothetical protein SAMN05444141_104242 [Pseudovibrio denitrificans]|uniref:Uncharacterized protein n=1 Tax=Pseudovibrio denitrificans TaxID=258256 RepID=A0A1I7BS34_9HYPH|nr:hypothetical protein SAMN05444141_104242 [Pseudovibrio denitrificans]
MSVSVSLIGKKITYFFNQLKFLKEQRFISALFIWGAPACCAAF